MEHNLQHVPFNYARMHSKFEGQTPEELQRILIYLIRKFIFGLDIESKPEDLEKLREEIKELMRALQLSEKTEIQTN